MAKDSPKRDMIGKVVYPRFPGCSSRIHCILAGNDGIHVHVHKSLDEFEIRPEPTTDYVRKNLRLMIGKTVSPRFLLFKLAGNKDIHQRFDELEFRPNPTADYKFTCTRASKIDEFIYYSKKFCIT